MRDYTKFYIDITIAETYISFTIFIVNTER